jgi:hypothetical protein
VAWPKRPSSPPNPKVFLYRSLSLHNQPQLLITFTSRISHLPLFRKPSTDNCDTALLHSQQVTATPEASALGHREICVCLEDSFLALVGHYPHAGRDVTTAEATLLSGWSAAVVHLFTSRDILLHEDPCQAIIVSCHDLRISSTCHAVATCRSSTATHILRSTSGDTATLLAGAQLLPHSDSWNKQALLLGLGRHQFHEWAGIIHVMIVGSMRRRNGESDSLKW